MCKGSSPQLPSHGALRDPQIQESPDRVYVGRTRHIRTCLSCTQSCCLVGDRGYLENLPNEASISTFPILKDISCQSFCKGLAMPGHTFHIFSNSSLSEGMSTPLQSSSSGGGPTQNSKIKLVEQWNLL